jgi:Ca-activated chloride channel family protein
MQNNWNIRFWEYEYLQPYWLILLVVVPIYLLIAFKREKKTAGQLKFTGSTSEQKSFSTPLIGRIRQVLIIINALAFSLLIMAMAKPFHWSGFEDVDENYKNGIDIILAMDVSMSMLAMDFEPNRLEVAKKVAKQFVRGRKGDRIGLVVYAGEAYTACPATLDYSILTKQIDQINGENIEPGTAIGTGLGTAVTRLRNDSLPSKVIILLTDGSNNMGDIDPLTAAELAKAKNIRVYTIGVGSNGEASTPIVTPFGIRYENLEVEIDEMTLTKIAKITDGKYFRATDEKSLTQIYGEIDQLEKIKMLDRQYKSEPPSDPTAFLNWSVILLLISWFSNRTLFKWHE